MNIVLGTAQFGLDYGITNQKGMVSKDDVFDILSFASDNGVTSLDTAAQYGMSEQVIGLVIKELSKPFKIITKTVNLRNTESNKVTDIFNKGFDNSVAHLGDNINGLLFHSPADLLSSNGDMLYEAAFALKSKYKKDLKLGFSTYELTELETILSRYKFDLVQIPFSIFDQRFRKILLQLEKSGIEVHTRSAFLQGLLLQPQKIPVNLSEFTDYFNKYQEILIANNILPLKACLQFVASYVQNIVLGVTSVKELKEILGMVEICLQNCDLNIFEPFAEMPQKLIDPRFWNKV